MIRSVAHKRNRPLLNLVRHSLGADEDGVKKVGAESGTSGKHRIGTPVRDLINKVVNGGHNKGDDTMRAIRRTTTLTPNRNSGDPMPTS